jgi:hypothetical protein
MTGMIVKFPYIACRRVHSRKGRISKNGTPEERAAKAATTQPDPASLANVVQLSRKPVEPVTPPSAAEFMALVSQLPPSELPWVSDMMRSFLEKNGLNFLPEN